jgi:hypothetical protein
MHIGCDPSGIQQIMDNEAARPYYSSVVVSLYPLISLSVTPDFWTPITNGHVFLLPMNHGY